MICSHAKNGERLTRKTLEWCPPGIGKNARFRKIMNPRNNNERTNLLVWTDRNEEKIIKLLAQEYV